METFIIGPQEARGGLCRDDHVAIIAPYHHVDAVGSDVTYGRRQAECDLGCTLGIAELLRLWEADAAATGKTVKPIVLPTATLHDSTQAETLYISSDLFSFTFPVRWFLEHPTQPYLDRLIADLGLPTLLTYHGVVGIRVAYELEFNGIILDGTSSFLSQGISSGSVVYIVSEIKTFAAKPPREGSLGSAKFRGSFDPPSETVRLALRQVQLAAQGAGLRI